MEEPACRLVPVVQKVLDGFLLAGQSQTQKAFELEVAVADREVQNSVQMASSPPAEQVLRSP